MRKLLPAPNPLRSRRQFLASAFALAAVASPARSAFAAETLRPILPAGNASAGEPPMKPASSIQIGALLGTFRTGTLEQRLDRAKTCGLEGVQMSFDCLGLPTMPDEIPPDLANRVRREAAARGLRIAAVDGTFNMSHPDPEHRRKGLQRLRVLAEACAAMGTANIHLCTGTRDRNSMWRRHPDNASSDAWHDMIACLREATDIARQANVVLAFEPEVNSVVDSPRKARRLLDEIASPHLKVTIDPANIFHSGELPRMREILDEAFELLGKDIVLAHAKDLDHDGDAGHLAAGHGKLDYDRYLALLHASGFAGPLLLHGLSEAQVPDCVAFLRKKLEKARSEG